MKLFGRKKGRRLSKRKLSLIETLLPKISLNEDCVLEKILSSNNPIFLEVGFGHGENLIKLSKDRPNWIILGIEPFVNGIASVLDKIDSDNISNIFILHGDARDFLKLIPDNSISEACILFPDPWPKKKHILRRIVQYEFLLDLSNSMKKDALVYLSSDHWKAQQWILRCFLNQANYQWIVYNLYECYEKPDFFEVTKYMKKSIKEKRQVIWTKFKNSKVC